MRLYDILTDEATFLPIEGIKGKHILMSIEELREVWEAAKGIGYDEGTYGSSGIHPDLHNYFKSKGIILP